MLRSMFAAVSGLRTNQLMMDVVGNNIANVNTTAYKAARTEFADSFSDTLRISSSGSATTSGQPSMQIGTGVNITSIDSNWNEGPIASTGVQTDLAISGNGFFLVRDTVSNNQYVTRAGNFSVDANGYLVTSTGERVQGYSDAGLATQGDIKIDTTGMPATSDPNATITSFSIDGQGKVNVHLSDGTSFVRGEVLLQTFQAPQMLVKQGNNLYSGMGSAGGLATPAAPGGSGLGKIQAGALESSNVDLSNEMANLISAQRAFEANSKIITTSDEVLQVLDSLKH